MKYINNSGITKTFYGVEFKPGDIKDVPGYINAIGFLRTEVVDLGEAESESKSDKEQATEPVVDTEKPTRTRKSNKTETSEKGDE